VAVLVSHDPVARSAGAVAAVGRGWSLACRRSAALLLTFGLVVSGAACGMEVQTTNPYTPADGINADVGEQGQVKVRNLMILSRADGQGFLSASLVADQRDALTAVSAVPVKADGSDGTPLAVSIPDPVALGNNTLVVLTDRAPITLTGPDLKAGLEVKVVLQFATAGQLSLTIPVLNGNQRIYQTVSPTPAPST